MCTLILLDRVVPGVPVVVAANRDEFYARPAAPPALFRSDEAGRASFVAPQDLEAGGTWMGVNEHGLFAGLTNRRNDEPASGAPLARPPRARRARLRDARAALDGLRSRSRICLQPVPPAGRGRRAYRAGLRRCRRLPRARPRARNPRGRQRRPGGRHLRQARPHPQRCGAGRPGRAVGADRRGPDRRARRSTARATLSRTRACIRPSTARARRP